MIQIAGIALEQKAQCEVIGVCGSFTISSPEFLFIDDHGDDPEVCLGNCADQVAIECPAPGRVSQAGEASARVQDVIAMQDHRIVGMMGEMTCLHVLQIPVESQIVGILKPTPKQTEKTVRESREIPENMIA